MTDEYEKPESRELTQEETMRVLRRLMHRNRQLEQVPLDTAAKLAEALKEADRLRADERRKAEDRIDELEAQVKLLRAALEHLEAAGKRAPQTGRLAMARARAREALAATAPKEET